MMHDPNAFFVWFQHYTSSSRAAPPHAGLCCKPIIGRPILQVAMLRSHIDRMGLEASGRLKSDLQQCLCDALRDDHSGKGGHASRRTAGKARAAVTAPNKKTSGGRGAAADADGDADEEDEEDEEDEGKGRKTEEGADQADKSHPLPIPAPVLPPSKVLFHNKAVSTMTQEERREALQELDVASLRKDDQEVTHDLVDALVLRKAEAADMNPRKQAWRGRHVYMMRKAELADMLGDFELDDTGKVEEMRTRFRKALRNWAAEEIKLPAAGAGASASVSDIDSGEEEAGSGNKLRGQSRRPTRSEDAAAPNGNTNTKSKPRATASRQSPSSSSSKKAAKEARSASASASASSSASSRRRRGRSSSITSVDDVVGASSRSRSRSRSRGGGPHAKEKKAASSSLSKRATGSGKTKATIKATIKATAAGKYRPLVLHVEEDGVYIHCSLSRNQPPLRPSPSPSLVLLIFWYLCGRA